MNNSSGHIEVIFGPMFSGKSTELQRKVKRYTHAQKKCLVVNYIKDCRYSSEDYVATHDRQMLRAKKVERLEDLGSSYINYDVIAIDEAQFFSDVVEMAEKFANEGKIVIVAALDATFQRKPFGRVLELVPIAESIIKLSAVCVICCNDAAFTQRTTESTEVELIGGTDIYRPVCRSCFNETSKPKTPTSTTLSKENIASLPSDVSEKSSKLSSSLSKSDNGNSFEEVIEQLVCPV